MARQAAPAELEAFFNSLPGTRLTALEAALRQAILDFVQARHPKPFPLTEWIDRRIGGEIEVRRNETGQDELFMRGAAPPAPAVRTAAADVKTDPQKFFSSLDPNAFSAEEDQLRDAVFEFLARWKSRELATYADLAGDPGIRRAVVAFLPPEVVLKDWVEQRIGGEVEFKADPQGQEIVHLTPSARPYLTAKYEKLHVAGKAAHVARGQPPGSVAAAPAAQARGAAAPPNATARDAFFAGLPTSELTPGELALRSALLSYIEDWPRLKVQLGKPSGACPLLSDLAQDQQVQRARSAVLPAHVPLKEWIDRRIGGEIELRKDDKGQFELWICGTGRGTGPALAAKRASERRPGGIAKSARVCAEDFINKLPSDRHTDHETELRQSILGYLEGKEGPVQLLEATRDRTIAQCRSAFLPPEVPLRLWIDRRIGGEVETSKDEMGRFTLQIRAASQAEAESGPDKEVLKEQFFADLPADGFTPDEKQLREALLDFLDAWKAKEPPSLLHAGGDARVMKSRAKVLPKGTPVTLKDWIDRRIGGEIEMFEAASGQLHFGLRGQLNHALLPKKRGSIEPGHPPWKKGRGGPA